MNPTPQPDSPEQIIDEWLDNAMSTSILGWSPIDGYKGHEDNSEAEAAKDYDKYKAQAVAKLDQYYTNKFLEGYGRGTIDTLEHVKAWADKMELSICANCNKWREDQDKPLYT